MGMMFVSAENRAHVGSAVNIGSETTVVVRWPITIGSAGVTEIMLADLGWYRPSTAEVNNPNPFTCVKAAFERGAVFQPIFKNGSRTWVINPGDNDTQPGSTNGSALVTASQFGIANFAQNEVIWFRAEFSFAASASMPCSDRVTTHVSGSQVRSFNPASTTLTNGVDSTGAFTFSGSTTTRTLGYCPWFVGNFVVDIEPKVIIGDGDSIMQSTGDTSFCPVGRGMFQRMLYGDGTAILAGCNLARAGSFMYDLHNSTKMQYWMTKANILWTQPGTNDFGVNPGTAITAATGISRVETTCDLARDNGIKVILRSQLGVSTQSASGNWVSDEDQTTIAAWGEGGRIPEFNSELYKLVGGVIDGIIRLDWWRSPTDQYKFKSTGANKYATVDGIHYSVLGSQQLGLEARADIDMVVLPEAPEQTVTLNLSYRDPETDLLESNPLSDSGPDAFTFTDQTGVALDDDIESNTVTITGITAPAPISITGGQYKINSGSYTSASGTINNNQTVTVKLHSSASNSTAANATVTVGGVSDTFTATTLAAAGSWRIAAPYRAEEILPMVDVHPRDDAHADAAWRWCSTKFDNTVRLAWQGGEPPYKIAMINSPAGASIGEAGVEQTFTRTVDAVVAGMFRHSLPTNYATVKIPAASVTNLAVYDYVITVTDQKDQVITFDFSVTADDSKYKFFNSVTGSDLNTGTFESPFQTFLHGFNLSGAGGFIYAHMDGTYSVTNGAAGNATIDSSHCRSYIGIGTSRDTVIFDETLGEFAGAVSDFTVKNLTISGGVTAKNNPRLINFNGPASRFHAHRVKFDTRFGISDGGDNPCGVFFPDLGSDVNYHEYSSISDCSLASTSESSLAIYFSCRYFIEENNTASSVVFPEVNGSLVSHAKGRCKDGTYRFNDYSADSLNGIIWVSNQNASSCADVELVYNRLECAGTDNPACVRWNGQVTVEPKPPGQTAIRNSVIAFNDVPYTFEDYTGGDDVLYSATLWSSTSATTIDDSGGTSLTITSVKVADVNTISESNLGIRGWVIASTEVE